MLVKSYCGTNATISFSETSFNEATSRNWNSEFQSLIELPDSRIKFLGLRNLEHDFVYAAETYGKIIISEHCLEPDSKTIKPMQLGGIAGGQKFICQGILFKFAIDVFGLYDGDENAMKAASHELKGLTNYFHCGIENLHVPLMALIDYRGFRLMAISLIPISSGSLIYGSGDAGKTVFASDPVMNELMKQAGEILNVKKHKVAGTDVEVYGPGDIEGHKGNDDRLYLLDFARLAPPQPPKTKGEQFHKLFRMEFVRSFPIPLCSDAYCGLGRVGVREHNAEVIQAFQHYTNILIPDLARLLDDTPTLISDLPSISLVLHQHGVNLRHLGLVRSYLTNERLRELFLCEAVSRSIKSQLQHLLRKEMRNSGLPSEKPFRRVVLDLFNLVLGFNSTVAEEYWNDKLKKKLEEKYQHIFSLNTQNNENSDSTRVETINLRTSQNLSVLLPRVLQLTSIQLAPVALKELRKNPDAFEFVEPDIIGLNTKVTHLNLIDYADGMALYYEAENRTDNSKTQRRLLNLARNRLEASLQTMSTNYVSLLQLGNVIRATGTKLIQLEEKQHCFEKACKVFDTITQKSSALSFRAYYLWAKTKQSQAKLVTVDQFETYLGEAIDLVQKALNISNDHSVYALKAKILFSRGRITTEASYRKGSHADFVSGSEYYQKALEVIEEAKAHKTDVNATSYDPLAEVELLLVSARTILWQELDLYLLKHHNRNRNETEIYVPDLVVLKKAADYFDQVVKVNEETAKRIFSHFIGGSPAFTVALAFAQFSPTLLRYLSLKVRKSNDFTTLVINEELAATIENPASLTNLFTLIPSITSLVVRYTSVNNWANLIKGDLASIELKNITECSAESFKTIMQNAPNVSSLTFDPSEHFVELIPHFPSGLKSLSLQNIGSVTEDHIISVVKKCGKLETLIISNAENVTDATIAAIAENCPLQQFHISGCAQAKQITTLQEMKTIRKLEIAGNGYSVDNYANFCAQFPVLEIVQTPRGFPLAFSQKYGSVTIQKSALSNAPFYVTSHHLGGVIMRALVVQLGMKRGFKIQVASPKDFGDRWDQPSTDFLTVDPFQSGAIKQINVRSAVTNEHTTFNFVQTGLINRINCQFSMLGYQISIDANGQNQNMGNFKIKINNEQAAMYMHQGIGTIMRPVSIESGQNIIIASAFSFICYLLLFENLVN